MTFLSIRDWIMSECMTELCVCDWVMGDYGTELWVCDSGMSMWFRPEWVYGWIISEYDYIMSEYMTELWKCMSLSNERVCDTYEWIYDYAMSEYVTELWVSTWRCCELCCRLDFYWFLRIIFSIDYVLNVVKYLWLLSWKMLSAPTLGWVEKWQS